MSEIVSFIGEAGFPIVFTLILLYRIETKLDQMIQAIDQLSDPDVEGMIRKKGLNMISPFSQKAFQS